MSIIKDISTLKKYLRINAQMNFLSIKPAIDRSTKNYLQPFLGKTFLNAINAKANGHSIDNYETSSENLEIILPLVEETLAYYSAIEFIPETEVDLTGGGIHQYSTENSKPANERQVNALLLSYSKNADHFLDELLEHLNNNLDNYPDWANDQDILQYNREIFITNSKVFSRFRDIGNSHRTFMALRPYIFSVQENYIKNELGETFYNSFKEKYLDDSLNTDEKILLSKIQPAIVHLSFWEGFPELNFSFEAGKIKLTSFLSTKTPKAALMMLDEIRQRSYNEGQWYLKKLTDYLIDNYTKFPLYDYSPGDDDESSFAVPVIKNDLTKKRFIGF
jgi:hypothetical protein